MPPGRTASRFESLPAAPFYLGLVLAGLATSLLGPILPILSSRWSLTDVQGGWLFAAQFTGSTCGSIVSSHWQRRSVVSGFASIAAGLAILTIGGYRAALVAFLLIGAGLGAGVAATNLIFGTEYPERRGSLLTWVNLYWGAGAVLAPGVVALAVREDALRGALLLLSLFAVLVFVFLSPLLRRRDRVADGTREPRGGWRFDPRIFVLFSAMLFLYVGAETAVAGWIATYAHRLAGESVARASLFVAAFWLSLVAGRGLVVLLLRVFVERTVLLGGLLTAMVGVAGLVFARGPVETLSAVVVTGLGCAPVFPLTVSRMFARIGRSRHTGWAFAICGSGGAVVPWITGAVSQYSGGLRTAFLTPLAALVGILICVLIEGKIPRQQIGFGQN